MAKAKKVVADDLATWIVNLERHVGVPLAITLIVSEGEISFFNAIDRDKFLHDDDAFDDDQPRRKMPEVKTMQLRPDYFG